MNRQRLLAPGPVEIPPQVALAMARPVIHHRTDAFRELFLRVRRDLSRIALTGEGEVLILAGSGTAAFEAGLLASVPAGATVIALQAGKFGARWASMAHRFGYDVIEVDFPWGRIADPHRLAEVLRRHPNAAAIMTTHSETSTGALHDVRALAQSARQAAPDALLLVDCVTSLSVAELRPVEWGLDGVFSGSQKGLMLPPGLAFAWLSQRAWDRARESERVPSYYLDLHRERARQADGETAYTPAVSLLYGLEVALDLLLAAGIERVWESRLQANAALLAGADALGCPAFAVRPSPAVAALRAPEGVEAPRIVRGFARRGIRIAGGQDHARPVLFRPSVMGYADRYDALTLVAVLEEVLRELGQAPAFGQGVTAALRFLAEGGPAG